MGRHWIYLKPLTLGYLFLIHYLVEKWGWNKVKSLFLISDFEDPDINKHFHQIYGRSLETVDTEWRHFLRTKLIEED